MKSRVAAYVDYQQRAQEFSVGDIVYLFLGAPHQSGRVIAVWEAIGMVDVEWPHGSQRLPVEDLQRYEAKDFLPPESEKNNVPGGAGSVSVPGGPKQLPREASVRGVAEVFVKKALYWGAKDRKYRATLEELEASDFSCPKCKEGRLRKAVYKRSEGASEHLLGCPSCMFLIKRADILGMEDLDEGVL